MALEIDMILNSSRKLQVVLTAGATTNNLPVVVDFEDSNGNSTNRDTFVTNTNGTTAVDIGFAPDINTKRKIIGIQIYNRDTVAQTVQISLIQGTTPYQLTDVILQVDDVLAYTDAGSWQVTDANGNLKQSNAVSASTVNSIAAGAAPLPITGLAAAQGGAVTVTGGASSTAANAGGAVTLTGGTPGATGVGGAATMVGGIGGATSGTGGAVGMTGGAGTNGNAIGGAAAVTGGTGQGSAAGGAVTATGGAGGATGAGGALTATTGAGGATSGVSGDLTLATGTTTAGSGSATGQVIVQSGAGAASAAAVAGGASGAVTVRSQAGGANTGGATGQVGGAGGVMTISGGAGGNTNSAGAHAGGAGAEVFIAAGVGGNATAGTGNGGKGGDVYITPGTGGTTTGGTAGADGSVYARGKFFGFQAAPAAKTVSATLTAAEVLSAIITVAQGGGAASAQQLPLATAMDTALPDSVANDAFDFSVINISAVAAETASVTTNTGWTLVGNMLLAANTAVTDNSQGRFRARKTGAGAWVLYRIS